MSKSVIILGLVSAVLAGCAKSEKVPSQALETTSAEEDISPIGGSGRADPARYSAEETGNQNTVR